MPAFAQTPVLPEATPVGLLCALLRRPRPRSAVTAIRRKRALEAATSAQLCVCCDISGRADSAGGED